LHFLAGVGPVAAAYTQGKRWQEHLAVLAAFETDDGPVVGPAVLSKRDYDEVIFDMRAQSAIALQNRIATRTIIGYISIAIRQKESDVRELFELSARMVVQKNRVFRRYLLSEKPFASNLTVLLGQRGVGKTTMLIQHLLDVYEDPYSEKFLYVPMDHFIIGRRTMYEIAEDFENLGGSLICFDEIHKYPGWSKELKSINDSFPGLKVVASGSSILAIQRGSHDLSRRALVRDLSPLSFRAWLTMRGFDALPVISLSELLSTHRSLAGYIVNKLRTAGTTILAEFGGYLKAGYYPYSLEHENAAADFMLTLEQSVHTTIETDLPALFPSLTGASVQKIKQLLAIISGLVPFKPDLAGLKRSLHIGDERTLKTYLKHLEDAGIIRSLHRQGKSLNNLDKPEKLYLDNPNLMMALAGESGVDIGNLRETFLLSCFRREQLQAPERGDFQIGKNVFEVGGRSKGFKQVAEHPDSFLVLDRIETGMGHKIPLWLFGFLY